MPSTKEKEFQRKYDEVLKIFMSEIETNKTIMCDNGLWSKYVQSYTTMSYLSVEGKRGVLEQIPPRKSPKTPKTAKMPKGPPYTKNGFSAENATFL